MAKKSTAERFWLKVKKGLPDECWEWQGARTKIGHGRFRIGGHFVYPHRYAYELFNGSIPENKSVCHRCDNPPCVNPAHLFLGTHLENMRDKEMKGRGNKPNGERHFATTLKAEQVQLIRALYASGNYTYVELARKYGVSKACIGEIIKKITWRDI